MAGAIAEKSILIHRSRNTGLDMGFEVSNFKTHQQSHASSSKLTPTNTLFFKYCHSLVTRRSNIRAYGDHSHSNHCKSWPEGHIYLEGVKRNAFRENEKLLLIN